MLLLPNAILAMNVGEERDYMELLYRQHYRLMFATAWKYLSDRESVEDVVSESCISLMRNINTIRKLDCNKLNVYIVSTVRNTALNFYEKQKRMNSHLSSRDDNMMNLFVDHSDVEKKVVLEEELALVWKAIDQLPKKERQIMQMKYSMELSDEQIAKEVGLSVNSIRQYIARARKKIKAIVYIE